MGTVRAGATPALPPAPEVPFRQALMRPALRPACVACVYIRAYMQRACRVRCALRALRASGMWTRCSVLVALVALVALDHFPLAKNYFNFFCKYRLTTIYPMI